MIHDLGSMCDEFFVNGRLFFKLELAPDRESVLHFFDRVRREYPTIKRLRRRENALSLEEENDEGGSRRWLRMDAGSLRFGAFAPANREQVCQFGQFVMEQAPCHLTLSDLVYDHLEVTYGFELSYRGNHDQIVAETLFPDHPLSGFFLDDQASTQIIDAQPYLGIALTPACDLQAYLQVKSRTTTFEVRNNAYESGPITVLLIVRKYWGMDGQTELAKTLPNLFEVADRLASERVIPSIVNPLAAAIASRP
ncbi:MAG: hypothetical protein HY287_04990 [Planctomycetes bacterium]|nr:hypothetical protein [Planctomycetota bacterium]MBI3833670.1 hypothetical protein [Planctomycetota bacterium]